jgi:hypothetical protein
MAKATYDASEPYDPNLVHPLAESDAWAKRNDFAPYSGRFDRDKNARGGSSRPCVEAALDYLARGWALLPIRPWRKEPFGPLLPSGRWEPLSEHAATEEDVRRWFDQFPDINIGIFSGEVSNRLALIDIDYGKKPLSNGDDAPEALREYVASLETPVVWTPSGGLHIYGRSGRLADLANSRLDLSGTLVEIKARKGYVVAPPSVVNNGTYRFVKPLDGLSLASIDEILADLRTLFSQLETLEVRESTTSRVVGSRRQRKSATAAKLENQREARGLERYDKEEGFVEAVIRLLKISTRVDWTRGTSSKFCCILHPEMNPSASLFRTQNGVWVYSDHHQQEGRQVYPLVDVYARAKHGVRLPLTRNQRAKWKLRLLADTQRLSARPSDLDLPTLPAELSQDALKVFQGFALLQALTWADRPEWHGNPSTFARRFGARWCGLPETKRFDHARNALLAKGLLVQVGECVPKRGRVRRAAKLFNLPGYTPRGR